MHATGSYAASRALPGQHPARIAMPSGMDRQLVLPAPRPARMPWSTRLFTAGVALSAVALVAVLAGLPGRLAYDVDAPGTLVKPDTMDPLAVQRALDSNMKWIDSATSSEPGSFVHYMQAINEHERAIAVTAEALVAMDAAVRSINAGMGDVNATTAQLRASMDNMAQVSARSAGTMEQLDGDIGILAGSMQQLAGSAAELVTRMAAVERTAQGIARNGTARALDTTRDLNRSLPNEVPPQAYREVAAQ